MEHTNQTRSDKLCVQNGDDFDRVDQAGNIRLGLGFDQGLSNFHNLPLVVPKSPRTSSQTNEKHKIT